MSTKQNNELDLLHLRGAEKEALFDYFSLTEKRRQNDSASIIGRATSISCASIICRATSISFGAFLPELLMLVTVAILAARLRVKHYGVLGVVVSSDFSWTTNGTSVSRAAGKQTRKILRVRTRLASYSSRCNFQPSAPFLLSSTPSESSFFLVSLRLISSFV